MPRQKRTFVESEANASQHASKKSKATMAPAGKENEINDLGFKTKAELASMLKVRGLPHTGKKAELLATLQGSTGTSSNANKDSTNVSTNTVSEDIEYIPMCRPFDDIEAERYANNEGHDSDAEVINPCGTASCMCNKPAKDHPEWKFIISKKGFDAVRHFQQEAMNRDQDLFDEYHYNDFSGYGFQEAVHNEIQAFHNEYTKTNADPLALWYRITGLAHVIPGPGAWFMCDDSEGIAQTIKLLGYALLATMDLLKMKELLTPDSKIKDLPLVLAMYLGMLAEWECQEDEFDWTVPMIEKAEANGITISGPYGIEDRVASLKEEHDGEDGDWTKFDWKQKVSALWKLLSVATRTNSTDSGSPSSLAAIARVEAIISAVASTT